MRNFTVAENYPLAELLYPYIRYYVEIPFDPMYNTWVPDNMCRPYNQIDVLLK